MSPALLPCEWEMASEWAQLPTQELEQLMGHLIFLTAKPALPPYLRQENNFSSLCSLLFFLLDMQIKHGLLTATIPGIVPRSCFPLGDCE